MITYVNTVFVSNNANAAIVASPAAIEKGKFVIMDCSENVAADAQYITSITSSVEKFKIGIGTGKTNKDHNGVSHPDIRWSNIIKTADIKGIAKLNYPGPDTEDKVTIDFNNLDSQLLLKFQEGGKRIIVRLTFKDLPTRFRKWTESYEYVTPIGVTKAQIASDIAEMINKQWKRARVIADGTTTSGKVVLTAMQYDDDNSNTSLNWANKVRFNANVYYTDPAGDGWESTNKHFPKGVAIDKVPGMTYAASAKLVRDREAQAMGYMGILNHGEGTWPIIQPAMETNIEGTYDAITLEFENMYRTADDLFRKTKQTVEFYVPAGKGDAIYTALNAVAPVKDAITEKGNITAPAASTPVQE